MLLRLTFTVLLSVSLLALAPPPEISLQSNTCSWETPCGGSAGSGCSVVVASGPQFYAQDGTCMTTVTITVTCAGEPGATCTVSNTVACDSASNLSITCDGTTFDIDPDAGAGGENCGSAGWGSMGESTRCGCVTIACS
ncbi:MAG: hypothetical protein ACI9EF_003549 [Pseudohongiellaceae bacterium]|jgi:hypothetical protein